MQKALESIFGPEILGLVGFAVMLLIFVPKVVRHYRGVRSHKKDPANKRTPVLGLRAMTADPTESAASIDVHPDHGEALAFLRTDYKAILFESILWIVPLIAVFIAVPAGQRSLLTVLLVPTGIFAFIGLYHLIHLGDQVIFYRTGAILRHKLHKTMLDYNAICEITERKPLFPWMAPSYILHLEDDNIIDLDGTNYIDGRKQLKRLLHSLDARVIRSAADETKRMG
ncbi:MAG: hypothetical protein J6A01_12470 [Proteobacteria bacterium]|nr:hypothetical protein [Pseudomonadota bacterium]